MTITKYLTRYGATFITSAGRYHSYKDFGLYPQDWPNIPPGAVKTHVADVPAADGGIDLSEYPQGFAVFKNRTGVFTFILAERARYASALTAISAALHGREADIVLDEDPGFRYHGRVSVDKMECDRARGIITVKADLEPFKYELTSTVEDWLWDPFDFETGVIREYGEIAVDGETPVTVWSSPVGGIPVITASAAMTVAYGGESYSLRAGRNVVDEIALPRGVEAATLTFTGSGTVSIDFTAGYL